MQSSQSPAKDGEATCRWRSGLELADPLHHGNGREDGEGGVRAGERTKTLLRDVSLRIGDTDATPSPVDFGCQRWRRSTAVGVHEYRHIESSVGWTYRPASFGHSGKPSRPDCDRRQGSPCLRREQRAASGPRSQPCDVPLLAHDVMRRGRSKRMLTFLFHNASIPDSEPTEMPRGQDAASLAGAVLVP